MDTAAEFGTAYRPRLLDGVLEEALETAGAVVIEGPRACGKTMTALNAAGSYVLLDDADAKERLEIAPQSLLDGCAPRLLDEWQLVPQVWNMVRRAVDRDPRTGRFILTGSSVPADDATRHSGAGRYLRLRQHTLTWSERDQAANGLSLAGLIRGEIPETNHESIDYTAITSALLTSGFPAMSALPQPRARWMAEAYLDEISHADLARVGEVRHSPTVIRRLLASLARNTASPVSYRTLTGDVRAVAPDIKESTVARYIELLERLFVIDRQAAWTPSLRSRGRLRTHDKLRLADPMLAAVALGADANILATDFATAGLLFESAVVHDLNVLVSPFGGSVRHFRDSNGRELDAVLTLPDGRWAAVEIKLGAGRIGDAAASIEAAVKTIDTASVGEPMFRLIVTATGSTFTLDNGTVTAPLHRLVP